MALPGAPLTFYVNADDQKLVRSAVDPAPYTVPRLFQGDSLPVEFQLLYRSDAVATALVVVPTTEYSVQIILVTTAGTQLAYQNSFTDDSAQQTKLGILSLNTAAIDSALSGVPYVDTYLQIRCTGTDGTTRTVMFADTLKINKTYLTAVAAVVPPSETAATESWVRGTFFPKSGTSGGDVKIMQSESGAQFRFYVDDDGMPHFDRIT